MDFVSTTWLFLEWLNPSYLYFFFYNMMYYIYTKIIEIIIKKFNKENNSDLENVILFAEGEIPTLSSIYFATGGTIIQVY